MKWGKCIKGRLDTKEEVDYLTIDKIYEVLESNQDVYVIDDFNEKTYFHKYSEGIFYIGNWFEDATEEIRDNNIKKILDEN